MCRVVLPVKHLGHRTEKMYHSQQVVGFLCVLCCKGSVDADVAYAGTLIEVSFVVAVCEFVSIVFGLVCCGNLWSIRKYYSVATRLT